MAEMSFTSDLPLPLPSSALGDSGSLCHSSKLDVQVERKGNDGTRMCAEHVDKSFSLRAQTPTHFNACQFIFIHVIMYTVYADYCATRYDDLLQGWWWADDVDVCEVTIRS